MHHPVAMRGACTTAQGVSGAAPHAARSCCAAAHAQRVRVLSQLSQIKPMPCAVHRRGALAWRAPLASWQWNLPTLDTITITRSSPPHVLTNAHIYVLPRHNSCELSVNRVSNECCAGATPWRESPAGQPAAPARREPGGQDGHGRARRNAPPATGKALRVSVD